MTIQSPPNEQLNLTLYPGPRLRKAQVNAVLGGNAQD